MTNYIARAALFAVAVSFCAAGAARGAVMANAGFEALVLADGQRSTTANPPPPDVNVVITADPAPGWRVDTQAGGTLNPTAAQMPAGPIDGSNVGYSNGAILSQQFPVDPATHYVFSIAVGRPAFVTAGQPFEYRVFFSTGGLVQPGAAQDFNTLAIAPGTWGTSVVSWDSPATVAPGTLFTVNAMANNGVVYFDNAGLNVPEPMMGAVGMMMVAAGMMRRQRA